MDNRYDIAVIGTGPAGLEAAITSKIRGKKVLLIGSADLSAKLKKAHLIQNYLGNPDISGELLGSHFADHLKKMDLQITEDKINAIYSMGDYFMLQGSFVSYESKTVILATGVLSAKPYPGENENLGRGVSYCATCDAALYRGKTVAVIAGSPDEEKEALFLAEGCESVLYLPLYRDCAIQNDKIQVITEKPQSIEKCDDMMALVTDQNRYFCSGVFILRESISASQLVPGLETDGPHVRVNRLMETNLPGCFACGDLVGLPYQYIKAAGEGNVAALSAVNYLYNLK